MNYRHAFHAGNFADVVKHLALALSLERLNAKPAPWRYIDTHAGSGLYDLSSDEARRSPEWREGIGRVWSAFDGAPAEVADAIAPLIAVLRALNEGDLNTYPGSPEIARTMARPHDALRLCELHAPSAEQLAQAIGRDGRAKIEQRDGYEALPAYLPPPERRGLVLIDPPFEEGTAERRLDFDHMLTVTLKAVKRWPTGAYILWRPLKDLDQVDAFDEALTSALVEEQGFAGDEILCADLWVRDLGSEGGLAGAGVVMLNPPYGVKEKLAVAFPWLADLMKQGDGAGWRLAEAGRS
jgi:23S rRNA (adenine2030-N6)-methyltransferase